MQNNKLFVGSLSWGTTDDQLREFFSQIGEVVSATVIRDRATGKSKGFGFVEMSSEQEAEDAIEKLNGQEFDGRTIVVSKARPKAPRDDRGGNRGNRDNFRERSYTDIQDDQIQD